MANNYQEVTLTPLGNSNSTNWNVDHGGKGSSDPGSYPVVSLSADSGAWLVHFQLKGNPQVKFSADPIAIHPGGKPVPPGVDSQITAVAVSSDGRDLFILDKNTSSGDLNYRINVDNHGALDPIIKNGGGTTPPSPYSNFLSAYSDTQVYMMSAALFIFAAAIGALLAKRWR